MGVKPEGMRHLGRPRHGWDDNIRMNHREIGWKDVVWIYLVQNRGQRQVSVNAVMNIRFPHKSGDFCNSWETISSTRRTLFRGVSYYFNYFRLFSSFQFTFRQKYCITLVCLLFFFHRLFISLSYLFEFFLSLFPLSSFLLSSCFVPFIFVFFLTFYISLCISMLFPAIRFLFRPWSLFFVNELPVTTKLHNRSISRFSTLSSPQTTHRILNLSSEFHFSLMELFLVFLHINTVTITVF